MESIPKTPPKYDFVLLIIWLLSNSHLKPTITMLNVFRCFLILIGRRTWSRNITSLPGGSSGNVCMNLRSEEHIDNLWKQSLLVHSSLNWSVSESTIRYSFNFKDLNHPSYTLLLLGHLRAPCEFAVQGTVHLTSKPPQLYPTAPFISAIS